GELKEKQVDTLGQSISLRTLFLRHYAVGRTLKPKRRRTFCPFELHNIMAQYRSKRYRAAAEKRDAKKTYQLEEAVAALKSMPATKFDQTITLSFRLG